MEWRKTCSRRRRTRNAGSKFQRKTTNPTDIVVLSDDSGSADNEVLNPDDDGSLDGSRSIQPGEQTQGAVAVPQDVLCLSWGRRKSRSAELSVASVNLRGVNNSGGNSSQECKSGKRRRGGVRIPNGKSQCVRKENSCSTYPMETAGYLFSSQPAFTLSPGTPGQVQSATAPGEALPSPNQTRNPAQSSYNAQHPQQNAYDCQKTGSATPDTSLSGEAFDDQRLFVHIPLPVVNPVTPSKEDLHPENGLFLSPEQDHTFPGPLEEKEPSPIPPPISIRANNSISSMIEFNPVDRNEISESLQVHSPTKLQAEECREGVYLDFVAEQQPCSTGCAGEQSPGEKHEAFDLNKNPGLEQIDDFAVRTPVKKKHKRPKVVRDDPKPVRVPKPKATPKKGSPDESPKTPTLGKPQNSSKLGEASSQVPSDNVDRVDGEQACNAVQGGPETSPSPRLRLRGLARSKTRRVLFNSIASFESVEGDLSKVSLEEPPSSTAIVLHSIQQSAIVLHKSKPLKPKVQMDHDDLRMWKLVMEHGPGYKDSAEEATERKWKDQREIYKKRAQIFIRVMHAVQGNRRFSKWKGSVIDSIVGAFLTQNVSDHLSSSAFMLLSAKFPGPAFTRMASAFQEVRVEEAFDSPERRISNQPGGISSDYFVDEPLGPSNSEDLEETRRFWDESLNPYEDVEPEGGPPSFKIIDDMDMRTAEPAVFEGPIVPSLTIIDGMRIPDHLGEGVVGEIANTEDLTNRVFQEIPAREDLITRDLIQGNYSPKTPKTGKRKIFNVKRKNEIALTGSERAKLEGTKTTSKDQVDWEAVRVSAKLRRATQISTPAEDIGDLEDAVNLEDTAVHLEDDFNLDVNLEDAVNWEAVRAADVAEIAHVIRDRGMQYMLAGRIKAFLDRVHREHGSLNLEWLRYIPQEDAKKFLLSIRGLGLKSVECVRLLTLHHLAFPVDTNVARIVVRLGWVPIEPQDEIKLLSDLELYPVQETIQKYLWPRLCKMEQEELYELHYQMITFGKVFCTKRDPNCKACPFKTDCAHYQSKSTASGVFMPAIGFSSYDEGPSIAERLALPAADADFSQSIPRNSTQEPIIEEPASPRQISGESADSKEAFFQIQSQALILLPPEFANRPVPKLKSEGRLRTVHNVYELPDDHPILGRAKINRRVADDPCPILLKIWSPDEVSGAEVKDSDMPRHSNPESEESRRETVKGTLMVPVRTAMLGNFPLNGTYFQVNEVFADHDTSYSPLDVPRHLIWNLPRRFVYCGSSVTSIMKGFNVEQITQAFQAGYVCVRGQDITKAPRPLQPQLHAAAAKAAAAKRKQQQSQEETEGNKAGAIDTNEENEMNAKEATV